MPGTEHQELVAYVPTINRAYLDLFDSAENAAINVLAEDVLEPFSYLTKDINALSPVQAHELLQSYYKERTVRLIGGTAMAELLADEANLIILPNDDVSRGLINRMDNVGADVIMKPLFLRWNRDNTLETEDLEDVACVKAEELGPEIIEKLKIEGQMAGNMWRRVGVVIFEDRHVVDSEHNESRPTPYTQAIEGDPRNALKRGVGIEFSNDHHAEARIIARSARLGRPLEGLSMLVTAFPCPPCAKNIAEAGIANLYFAGGYAVLDGRNVLESAGVKLVKVGGLEEDQSGPEWRDYQKR